MALLNDNGNYLKIEKLSFEKIYYKIYKSTEVRHNFDPDFDIVKEFEMDIISDSIGNMEIPDKTIKEAVITAGYLFLLKTPMFEGWKSV